MKIIGSMKVQQIWLHSYVLVVLLHYMVTSMLGVKDHRILCAGGTNLRIRLIMAVVSSSCSILPITLVEGLQSAILRPIHLPGQGELKTLV